LDNRIRQNQICIIGQPRCDFTFASSRTCFISYGFKERPLETSILKRVLLDQDVFSEEAGGSRAPGQNVFCAKICSKIITSQFCIVLLNNDERDGKEIPNANVNMEYGMMLGFNKYIIPFQKAAQKLPFNLAGLDTIKYNPENFESLAKQAIAAAVELTRQDEIPTSVSDQAFERFLIGRGLLVSGIDGDGERNIYRMGQPLGFALLHDFSGDYYSYFGRFTTLRPESVIWRIQKLTEIVDERRGSIPRRILQGILPEEHATLAEKILSEISIMAVVMSNKEKSQVVSHFNEHPINYKMQIDSVDDVANELILTD